MRWHPEKLSALTGRGTEEDYLGAPKANTDQYQNAYRSFGPDKNGYLPFEKAKELAKHFQPWDPANPEKPLPHDLRIEVAERLVEAGMIGGTDADKNRVRYYTSLHTPLDYFHGVDGFIEFTPKDGPPVIVTLDITMQKDKLEGERTAKADIVFGEVPDAIKEEKQFLAAVDDLAEQVIEKITQKLNLDRKAA